MIDQDPFMQTTIGSIDNALSVVDDKVRQINLSFAKGEEKIFSSAKTALDQLRLETDVKLAKLEAVERELLRREDSLKMAQKYFQEEREESNKGNTRKKVEFLQMYKNHLILVASLTGRSNEGAEKESPTAAIQKELNVIAEVKVRKN